MDLPHDYEKVTLTYTQPETTRRYKADFTLKEFDHVILETKGRFTSDDRKKMLLLQEQYPDKLFVMVFSRPKNTLSKRSVTSYGEWCDKNGLAWLSLDQIKEDPQCLLTMIQKKMNGSGNQKPKKKLNRSTRSGKQSLPRNLPKSLRQKRSTTG